MTMKRAEEYFVSHSLVLFRLTLPRGLLTLPSLIIVALNTSKSLRKSLLYWLCAAQMSTESRHISKPQAFDCEKDLIRARKEQSLL
jgi:hypothetical protein